MSEETHSIRRADAPPELLPIERVARIAASLDLDPELRADILAANELDEATWEAHEAAGEAALRAELARGRSEALCDHDRAYLARIEEERGPISIAEYAAIVTAQARGASAEKLRELELPAQSEIVIVRVFEARLAADKEARAAARRSR